MEKTRTIILVGALGGLTALALAIPSVLQSASANDDGGSIISAAKVLTQAKNDIFVSPVDPEGLVRWDFQVDASVSTEPVRQSVVKKIGYGHTELVSVVETSTGIYSSDALTDPHVKYPGIRVTRHPGEARLAYWGGNGWRFTAPFGAHSFVTVVPYEGGQLVVTDEGTCAVTRLSTTC